MTNEPIDLDVIRHQNRDSVVAQVLCDEIERLHNQLQATEEAWGYDKARIDGALAVHTEYTNDWEDGPAYQACIDCQGRWPCETVTLLTGGAS